MAWQFLVQQSVLLEQPVFVFEQFLVLLQQFTFFVLEQFLVVARQLALVFLFEQQLLERICSELTAAETRPLHRFAPFQQGPVTSL